jgi:hypothetical protein
MNDNKLKMENNKKEKEYKNNEVNNYKQMTLNQRYDFLKEKYSNLNLCDNKRFFKQSLNLKYVLNNIEHEFYYDENLNKFLLKSNKSENIFDSINDIIMYIRVMNMDEGSISWVHPFYINDIQYHHDNKIWIPISRLF